jgi:hypothetical protein
LGLQVNRDLERGEAGRRAFATTTEMYQAQYNKAIGVQEPEDPWVTASVYHVGTDQPPTDWEAVGAEAAAL